MEKINKQTPDLTSKNIAKITELFPNVITEKEDENGRIVKAVDFDSLRQELSKDIVEGGDERYRLDWPGKRRSMLKANTPINKTLKPDRDSSVNFDTTENVYIEGDNFEVLKILQESYLGKIKMIYIDPPYNTGTAMIYNNDFSKSDEEYDEEIGAIEEGIKMFKNTDSNGRFHSDWLSMMYERITISRDLLTEDGFMALAIDHNELHNLTSICDEIFGEQNRLGVITIVHKPEGRNQEKFFGTSNEFMLVYSKNKKFSNFNSVALFDEIRKTFKLKDEKGFFRLNPFVNKNHGQGGIDTSSRENKPNFWYPIYVSGDLQKFSLNKIEDYFEIYPISNTGQERTWRTKQDTLKERLKDNLIIAQEINGRINIFEKYYEKQVIKTHWIDKKYNAINYGTIVLDKLMEIKTFDFPKSLYLIMDVLKIMTGKEDIILDFFSGSATTAHAVMQLNAEDGGNRKFVMVQIPEQTDEKSEAYKAGYKTIADIGRERIRRAGKKILEENAEELAQREKPLDIGFRSYKVTDSIMEDVYKSPNELKQSDLLELADNIKRDKAPEDILTSIILDFGLTLDLPIKKEKIGKNIIYNVADGSILACFDKDIDFSIIDEIAKIKPLRVVFRDASFKDDKDRINVETKFKQLSPDTRIKVL